MNSDVTRRPIKSRQTKWANYFAKFLATSGISPNTISFLSIVFAALSFLSAYFHEYLQNNTLALFLAALFIQLRLMCNLLDGMVAVEFHKKSITGDLWNEVPDRVADLFIILGTGFFIKDATFALELTWLNISLSIMTAYIRTLGAALTGKHYFLGPMAKPHRMALLTFAYLLNIFISTHFILLIALVLMLFGQIITCFRRLKSIKLELENK